MNLAAALKLYNSSGGMGPGSIAVPVYQGGVISPDMRRRKGMTQIASDASPSDLAQHHTWQEPSSTDVTVRQWERKRALEKQMGRNLDPFESDAELLIRLHQLQKSL